MPIEIAFEADRLAAQPGCNGASGGYTMVDGKLTLSGPLAQTMMMCDDQALVEQDAWFASVLEASPVIALDGDEIVLTTDDTVLRGRDKEVANPDLPLEGTVWTITSRIDGAGERRGLQRALDGAVAADLRARRPPAGQHRVRRRRSARGRRTRPASRSPSRWSRTGRAPATRASWRSRRSPTSPARSRSTSTPTS